MKDFNVKTAPLEMLWSFVHLSECRLTQTAEEYQGIAPVFLNNINTLISQIKVNLVSSSVGETPSRTLTETATERARETALAAKEKAKDFASQAQKKQYVWRFTWITGRVDTDTGTDSSLPPLSLFRQALG